MGRTTRDSKVWAACLLAASCGGGGAGTGGSNGAGSRPLTGDLSVLQQAPTVDAVQVAIDATVWVRFDGVIVQECLTDDNIRLATSTGTRVPATFAVEGGGREVRVTPTRALAPETDYVVRLSPFVCDTGGRILADEYTFTFRTIDQRPPLLVSATVADNAVGVDRLASFTLTFDEPLDPATIVDTNVYLRDAFGGRYACALASTDGTRVTVDPLADLAGQRRYVLIVAGGTRGVTDRAGNVLAQAWSANFTTAPDHAAPRLSTVWPPQQVPISPRALPEIEFDESVDPASIEPTAITLVDDYSNVHRLRLETSTSQRRLRLVPLEPLPKGIGVRLTVAGGPGALTDLSGNPLTTGTQATWTIANDDTPPRVVSSLPANDATKVSLNVRAHVTLDKVLDPTRVGPDTVTLRDERGVIAATVALLPGNTIIEVAPDSILRPSASYTLNLRGGADGLRDQIGNVLAQDLEFRFRTTDDASLPQVILLPADGAAAVPLSSHVSAVFDSVIDANTVSANTVVVATRAGVPVAGTLEYLRGGRAVRFVPRDPWQAGTWYRITLRGGANGVREASGNWFPADEVHDFRAGFTSDTRAPSVRASINAAADRRKQNMQAPPMGFTIDVFAQDPGDYAFDPSSFEVTLIGPGATPDSDAIFAEAIVERERLSWRVPQPLVLATGDYQLQARARDLSGNLGEAETVTFTVAEPRDEKVPFERTHVVWTRTDMDRDGNGRSDFVDDLVKLGFVTIGDPAGLNERMTAILRDGVLAQAHHLFDRERTGRSRGDGSVAIRFTDRRPLGVAHMQIALGGLDPEGQRLRDYGDESTGVLGRAYYDHYNSQINDLDTSSRPGLGVFAGELFLFQALIHRRVYPAFVTSFGRRFLNLAPAMGGTPVGSHTLDAIVVAPGFDYVTATSEQRVRFDNIFRAADEWATAIGIILAHEVGHAVGLVAEGPSPMGLHGDASLHDEGAGVADVMSPAVGYDSLIQLDYSFRDLDLAYLRQRLILK